MYKHIVLWRLNEPHRAEEFCTNSAALLEKMRQEIPGLLSIELNADVSNTDMSSHIALYSEFESRAAYKGYDSHPLHTEFKQMLGTHRSERRVVDYEKN